MTLLEAPVDEIPADHRRCCRCKRVLPLGEFGRNRGRSHGMMSHCRRCEAERAVDKGKISRDRERARLAEDHAAVAEARTGWRPGESVSGFDGMGCPDCAGPLTLIAPSVPAVMARTWVLECAPCDVRWVLEQRIARLR